MIFDVNGQAETYEREKNVRGVSSILSGWYRTERGERGSLSISEGADANQTGSSATISFDPNIPLVPSTTVATR